MVRGDAPDAVHAYLRNLAREFALGFGYWLLFLLLLQPGNIFKASSANVALPIGEEFLRIGGASLLGAAVTPILLSLTRYFTVEGSRRWQLALVHIASILGLSVTVAVVAQLLANQVLTDRDPRLRTSLDHQIVADVPLLLLCMATFVAGAHALLFWRRAEQESLLSDQSRTPVSQVAGAAAPGPYLTIVPVKVRGRTLLVSALDIDWVETQGNYLALHVGSATHLVRGTLASLEASLDPRRFARIHRTALIAIDRVSEFAALSNGDASIQLRDGTRLRLSRNYRANAAALLAYTGRRYQHRRA